MDNPTRAALFAAAEDLLSVRRSQQRQAHGSPAPYPIADISEYHALLRASVALRRDCATATGAERATLQAIRADVDDALTCCKRDNAPLITAWWLATYSRKEG